MSPETDIEKRKEQVKARAAAAAKVGKVIIANAPAKVTPTNDYQAYTKAEKAAGREPASKVEWAEALVASSKARNGTPVPAAVRAKLPKLTRGADGIRTRPVIVTDEDVVAVKNLAATGTAVITSAKVKAPKDPNALTVSDIAREMGIEPKVARARLRKDGTRAKDGRWPTVTRDSEAHKALIAKLAKVGNEEAVKAATKTKGSQVGSGEDVAPGEDDDSDEE